MSRFFYDAKEASGLTLARIAAKAGCSTSTVGFLVNGDRGGGKQARSRATIESVAKAMSADPDRAWAIASGVSSAAMIDAIKNEKAFPKEMKEMMIKLAETYHPNG